MLKCNRYQVSCLLVILFLSLDVFSAEGGNWKKENALLREKIFSSLGKTPLVDKRQELSVEEIREALVLSCVHKPDCSRDELNDLRAGKPPRQYDEQQGLRNAEKIFGRKLVTVSRESGR